MSRKLVTFAGRVGYGVISVSGVEAGDEILSIYSQNAQTDATKFFAPFVLTDDEILQTEFTDLHSYNCVALIERTQMLHN